MFHKMFALSLIAAGLGTGIASAQVTVYGSDVVTARVGFADLNLGSPDGMDRLKTRIRSAAKSICLDHNIDPLRISMQRARCYELAVSDGFAKADAIAALQLAGKPAAGTAIVLRAR